jgi:hypothetical protein
MARKLPNGQKIYQDFPFQEPSKFIQIGIFGLKKTIWQPWPGSEKTGKMFSHFK